jgi:hypothetical protein
LPGEPQAYDGPANFHVDRAVYRIPHLRLELQPSTSMGKSLAPPRLVVIVLERGELPKERTKPGELKFSDRQQLAARWTGFRFEL